MVLKKCVTFLFFLFLISALPAKAQSQDSEVQTAWKLLDYIAIDYAGAVSNGAVSNQSEYAEQTEFAETVLSTLSKLPAKPEKEALINGAKQLKNAIDEKNSAERIATIAHSLAKDLLAAYPVPLAPAKLPDLKKGVTLFNQNCAACHGTSGDGHGPAAAALSTPPIAFTDLARARDRSIFGLYQIVTQGVTGTSMQSYAALSDEDRWALAFYVGQFAFSKDVVVHGESLWKAAPSLHQFVPDIKTLAGMSPEALATSIGKDKADAVMGYLRNHPEALVENHGPLVVVRQHLAASLTAYRDGDQQSAEASALSAYLDGLEPIEPTLGARDSVLLGQIESAMATYRAAIQHGQSADVLTRQVEVLNRLIDEAERRLSEGTADSLSTFLGAATILLREGLEALLIIVAMIAFLRKAERTEVMVYVHAGWASALAAGALTWAAATWFISVSGASRELTEGVGSVFAALVLLSVGIWMHGKSHADHWQRYIREKMSKALSGRSAWFLFALAFVVVYREVFETILFYAALWTQGNGLPMFLGALSACITLAIIAWGMLRYSRKLPIGKFFAYSAWLMGILTVVLAGKGVSALQEAGVIGITTWSFIPKISLIGLFPTMQTAIAQLAMIIALCLGFWWNAKKVSH